MDNQLIMDTISSTASFIFFIGIIAMAVTIVKKHRKSKDFTEV